MNTEPSAPPAANVYAATTNPYILPGDSRDVQLAKLRKMIQQFEITICQEEELTVLMDYNIVFLCDDSGSMTMSAHKKNDRKLDGSAQTRWSELKDTVTTLCEIACYLDGSGVDVHFLNREAVLGIRSSDQLAQIFEQSPQGKTPLATRISELPSHIDDEKPVLLVIATDGEPDEGPSAFQKAVSQLVEGKLTRHPWKIQILACTPDETEIYWLNNFDKKFKNVDVMDDFLSERDEVLEAGRMQTFNKADYVCKALLGPIVSRFDAADERVGHSPHDTMMAKPKQASNDGCNCAIC